MQSLQPVKLEKGHKGSSPMNDHSKMQSLKPVKLEKGHIGSNSKSKSPKFDKQNNGPSIPNAITLTNAPLPMDISLPLPTHLLPQSLLPENLKDKRNYTPGRKMSKEKIKERKRAREEKLKKIKEERLIARQKKKELMKERGKGGKKKKKKKKK